ncbi:MAG: hypothetical protein R3324_20535, partial [Halobacteriales archaeon]|nr:hypothetical protein [Halobacteriales archaeon]
MTGLLELNLIADTATQVEVRLRSKAICVSSTPIADFGVLDTGATVARTGTLQNCGTEPVTVTGAVPTSRVEVEVQEKLPYELRPAEQIQFVTQVQAESTGSLEGVVEFDFEDPMLTTRTKVLGWVAAPGCAPLEIETPRILVNNQPLSPRPNALTRFSFPDAPANVLHWVRLFEQPTPSHERIERVENGWLLRPRVVGRYRATITAIDLSTGERSCGTDQISLDVAPAEPLHIELTWSTDGDAIPGDLGFGQGANLDLHVLNTADGTGAWNEPATDCFPGTESPCGEAGGTVSLSHSGGIPEIATFSSPEGHIFEIGVYLSNPFNFDGVRARL